MIKKNNLKLKIIMKPLLYPFTFEQWLKHPYTKPKLKFCKEVAKKIDEARKYGKQLSIDI